eukprot:365864-Chlamydomonas_euryale.AAC.11
MAALDVKDSRGTSANGSCTLCARQTPSRRGRCEAAGVTAGGRCEEVDSVRAGGRCGSRWQVCEQVAGVRTDGRCKGSSR